MLEAIDDQESVGLFCHSALALLSKYDRENGTDLYHTLMVYLDSSCNVKQSAEKEFIHRNSLSYRLERIAEIGGIDLDDAETRFLLSVSYHIDHYNGRDSH